MELAINLENNYPLRPRIRTVILAVGLFILLLPLGGVGLFRIYETQLIRSTEGELIAQGSVVRNLFREMILSLQRSTDTYGVKLPELSLQSRQVYLKEPFDPIFPEIDLRRDAIRPPAEDAAPSIFLVEQIAWEAGQKIQPILQASQRDILTGVRIVDTHGVVVASTRTELGLSILHREEVNRALRGKVARLLRMREGEERLVSLASISRSTGVRVVIGLPVIYKNVVFGAVIVSRTPMNILKDLYQRRSAVLWMLVTVLGTAIVVSLMISLLISRPIGRLIHQSQQVIQGDAQATTPLLKPGTHEIGVLSATMARMATTLQERGQYIQTLAQSISHEFKTPLTSINGAVEIMEEHFTSMSDSQRQRFLAIIKQESLQMGRLVSQLLQLARADVFRPGDHSTEALGVLTAIIEKQQTKGRLIDLQTIKNQQNAKLQMDSEVFEQIVSNLVENAFQHGGESVTVTIRIEWVLDYLRLTIEDNGRGISNANLQRIFDPFFTTAQDKGGTGLGLAIIKSFVDAHGGSISVSSQLGSHTQFKVDLPLA